MRRLLIVFALAASTVHAAPGVAARATCRYIRVAAGSGCWQVMQDCGGISEADLKLWNGANVCNTLQPGQVICCSAGTPPDFTPQPNPDGTCATYTVKAGDTCTAIGAANSLTVERIEDINKNTYGFPGCNSLQPNQIICLSPGRPPFPNPQPGHICGPMVPGTIPPPPTSPTPWQDLNPCPLRACCNVWGQCGTTPDFCTPAPADNGAPGTAKPGSNGCISSCGVAITNNDVAPAQFMRVGYFEAWNRHRGCLHMDVKDMVNTKTRYTHVHFAFADITADYRVDVSKVQAEFEGFKALRGIKRILSFGGWSFSTEADTAPIFREGVTDENRVLFARNVVGFMNEHGLDGVDFDWEYPGAPDIPGIPAGGPNDGRNYLQFLRAVRQRIPAGKTLAIAAPASFWYLKGFPIAEMAPVLDYIIYMTYDLHGQWDYGSQWATPGCPNCAWHHTNDTEVDWALAMVTKAGVPAHKVIVGMALYGRSFQLAQPNCRGFQCRITGPASGATPGECTITAGYIANTEIKKIIRENPNHYEYYDQGDILVYNGNQYVGWTKPETYARRLEFARSHNFGGTSDWATDLDIDDIGEVVYPPWPEELGGEYFPPRERAPSGWPTNDDEQRVTYVNIINATPDDFVTAKPPHSYQMSTFAFGDVKALQARQNKQVYVDRLGSTWGDSGGEVTYAIAGTDKRFEVQARAASVGGHPMREIFSFENLETTGTPRGAKLEFAKRGYRQYNMILTGSEAYGRYYDGFNPPVAWMSAILDVIGERKLRHVSMIGSHDAGMSVRTGGTVFGQAANCLTQGFGVYDQLIFGARFFDIRPVIGNGGRLVTGHYSTGLKQGCNGQFIDDIVRQINRFTAEHPELVILHLSHALNTEDDYRSMNSQEWDRVFDAFEGLTHRCGGISGDLTSKTMNSFIGNGRACVLVIANQPNVRPAQGIYNIREQFEWAGEGHWSDTDRAEVMAESQTRHLRENRKIMQGTSGDKFYVMQWVLTLQGIDNVPDDENPASIAIETIATRLAYDSLFWKGWNAMRPDSYPTVMLLDFIGVMQQFDRSELIQRPRSELIALAMAVNLAIASQNPWVGGGTIYKRG